MYDLNKEKELVQMAKQGNRQAVGKLYDALFPGVYAYSRMRLPTTADAEDIVSDSFLAVVSRLPNFQWKRPGSFRAWVFQVVRNHIATFYRSNHGEKQSSLESKSQQLTTAEQIVEDAFIQEELSEYLLLKIKQLSTRRQEVLLLRYFGRLRNNEIALALNLDERTVSSHLSRALAQLQTELVPIHK